MNKHTPGPWIPLDSAIWKDKETADTSDAVWTSYVIAEVREPIKANMYLIAAAPDLLEACEAEGCHTGHSGPELLHNAADIISAIETKYFQELAIDLRVKADKEQNAANKARGIKGGIA